MLTMRAHIGINVFDHDSSRFSLRSSCAETDRMTLGLKLMKGNSAIQSAQLKFEPRFIF